MRTAISPWPAVGFFGDKRDVYDAAIALLIRRTSPELEEIFHYMEQGRARALKDRISASAPPATIAAIQRRLAAGSALLEFWMAGPRGAVLWITPSAAGLAPFDALAGTTIDAYLDLLRSGKPSWGEASAQLGAATLGVIAKLPLPQPDNLIVVADGLQAIPFESPACPAPQLLTDRFGATCPHPRC